MRKISDAGGYDIRAVRGFYLQDKDEEYESPLGIQVCGVCGVCGGMTRVDSRAEEPPRKVKCGRRVQIQGSGAQ